MLNLFHESPLLVAANCGAIGALQSILRRGQFQPPKLVVYAKQALFKAGQGNVKVGNQTVHDMKQESSNQDEEEDSNGSDEENDDDDDSEEKEGETAPKPRRKKKASDINVDVENADDIVTLDDAIKEIQRLRSLARHYVSTRSTVRPCNLNFQSPESGMTALTIACRRGHIDAVVEILRVAKYRMLMGSNGLQFNTTVGPDCDTVLHQVVKLGGKSALEILKVC